MKFTGALRLRPGVTCAGAAIALCVLSCAGGNATSRGENDADTGEAAAPSGGADADAGETSVPTGGADADAGEAAAPSGGADSALGEAASEAGTICSITENDAGSCSSVDPTGPVVVPTCSSSEPPQAQGGVIEDGTYVLDSATYFGACPATPQAQVESWSICGDHWDTAWRVVLDPANPDAGTSSVFRLNFSAAVQGASVTFDLACVSSNISSSGFPARGYSAAPGEFTYIYSANGAVVASHHHKQ